MGGTDLQEVVMLANEPQEGLVRGLSPVLAIFEVIR